MTENEMLTAWNAVVEVVKNFLEMQKNVARDLLPTYCAVYMILVLK